MKIPPLSIVMLIAALAAACQPIQNPPATLTPVVIPPTVTIAPPTPTSAAWGRWSEPGASIEIKAQLGRGAGYALDISPDGRLLAVAGATGLAIYRFDTLEELWRSPLEFRKEIPEYGVCVAWSPDGKRLATTSAGDAILWDAATGAALNELKELEQDYYVASVAWAPDGRSLSANVHGNAPAILLFDLPPDGEIASPRILDGVDFMRWMPGGKDMAVTLASDEIVILSVDTGKQTPPLFKEQRLSPASLSADGTQVISLKEYGKMALWDVRSGKQIPVTYAIPNGRSATRVSWSPDGQKLATAIDVGWIIIWDVHTGALLHTLRRKQSGNTDEVLGLVWTSDGKNLISLSRYEAITVWDVESGEQTHTLNSHTGWVMSLAWSPQADRLASGSEDGQVIIWDPATGKQLLSFQDPSGWVYSLAWSPDGERLASGGNFTTTIWDPQTGKKLKEISGQGHGVNGIAWSADGKRLVTLSGDGQGIIRDGNTYEQIQELKKGIMYSASGLTWSRQGDVLAVNYWPQSLTEAMHKISIWNPESGEILYTKEGFSELAWSPVDDNILAVAQAMPDNQTVVLWNYKTDQDVARWNLPFMVFGLTWSQDGRLLLVNSLYSIHVLDARTGKQIQQIESHVDGFSAIQWSPRGDLLATASIDGTIILWGIKTR